ncbi:MAG TPA: tRNA 2-thiouridine(34) synthase MnmA [Dehalococcoidia bacterium]|nr:tRNA 2-thiouridine(34) synthase MnmA [Dehalococcoidia bacterium]
MSSKKRVVVAMSGGVDSAVAAGLLVRQGYDVVGITMRLWTKDDALGRMHQKSCCGIEDTDDARAVADILGFPHYTMNLEEEFGRKVVDYFVSEYERGRTPNPCLACNEHVKFRALLDRAIALDADYLATGHYARVRQNGGSFELHRADDDAKDQSYVLYTLGQADLSRLLFPVGDYPKPDIRKLALEMGLPLYAKPDSAEICFVPGNDYRAFLADRIDLRAGEIVDRSGAVVGEHSGVAGYTIGQRKGLGAFGGKRFVTSIDPELNVITIGDDEDLLSSRLWADKPSWVAGHPPSAEFEASVKVRYKSPPAPAFIRVHDGLIEVELKQPLRAVTPGQAAVIYDGDRVLGGGIIARTATATEGQDAAGILRKGASAPE